MFESLTERFESIFRRLGGHGKITERHLDETLREVRLALLEADVHFKVVRDLVESIREKALGREVLKALTPEQQLVRIVHEELVALMGEHRDLDLHAAPPVPLLFVGLQGSGKTTTVAKVAHHLKVRQKRSPLLVPLDLRRPAAIEQLRVLGEQVNCDVYPSTTDQSPETIAREALELARKHGHDVCLFDTAGRLHIDEELMSELTRVRDVVAPRETVLVVDAMTGQDAVNVAEGFHGRLDLTGTILTKMEGDARGGAALSIRKVTGTPILFLGVGEKVDALEAFHPERLASRVLGMGDILTLAERAEQAFDRRQAEDMERKFRRAEFSLEDFRDQLRAIRKMGSMTDLLGMIPGFRKMAKSVDPERAEKDLKRVEAIINSMTPRERRNPGVLNGSRRRRIAAGSGTTVADINRFLKQYTQMKKMMKKVSRKGAGGLPAGLPF